MRRFRDRDGFAWDVVLGHESWGASVALFVPPAASDQVVRQALLQASGHDAVRALDGMDDAALQALLDESLPKEEGLQ